MKDEFREDLFFRVNTFEVRLPPLRERVDDIATLAVHLAKRFGAGNVADESISSLFAPETLELLCGHAWPGNVRELANVVEHAMILRDEGPILPEHLPGRFVYAGQSRPVAARLHTPRLQAALTLRELEMEAIHAAVDRHDGNKSEAAKELGVSLKTLYNKLNSEVTRKSA